jgi:hypothetical protein
LTIIQKFEILFVYLLNTANKENFLGTHPIFIEIGDKFFKIVFVLRIARVIAGDFLWRLILESPVRLKKEKGGG